MRLLKLALISLIFLFLLVTIFSLFIPSSVRISKAIVINTNREAIIQQLSDPAEWKKWYPGMDSSILYTEDGKAAGMYLNKNSNRYLKITSVTTDEVIAEYFGVKQKKVMVGWKIVPGSGNSSNTVQWYMDFKLRWYPWEKFSGLLYEKQYGPQMEQGLANLKTLLENSDQR